MEELILHATKKNVVISIGHTGATYEQAKKMIKVGAKSTTHTFNGMRLFHQHQPAVMGAALESNIYCEAICDGRHLHPGTVSMLLSIKGKERFIAITDSMMAAGMPDGRYKLGINDIIVKNGMPNWLTVLLGRKHTHHDSSTSKYSEIYRLRPLLCNQIAEFNSSFPSRYRQSKRKPGCRKRC